MPKFSDLIAGYVNDTKAESDAKAAADAAIAAEKAASDHLTASHTTLAAAVKRVQYVSQVGPDKSVMLFVWDDRSNDFEQITPVSADADVPADPAPPVPSPAS